MLEKKLKEMLETGIIDIRKALNLWKFRYSKNLRNLSDIVSYV